MRMQIPPKKVRQKVTKCLVAFFQNQDAEGFKKSLKELCNYYKVKRPEVEWVPAAQMRKNAGLTFDDGRLHLISPVEWCNMAPKYDRSLRQWLLVFFHEFSHYLHWVNDEDKADEFAKRMLARIEGVPK